MKPFCKVSICIIAIFSVSQLNNLTAQTRTYLITNPPGLGGFEGSSVDTSSIHTAPGNKWRKGFSTINLSTPYLVDTVRSGSKTLRIKYTSSGTRVLYSPKTQFKPIGGTPVTVQYFRRSTSTINTVNVQPSVRMDPENITETGAFETVTVSNIWEKRYFTTTAVPNSNTTNSYYAAFNLSKAGAGGDYYMDDVCIYSGAYDITAPNDPSVTNIASAPAIDEATNPTNSVKITWSAPVGGIDGGGYMVVVYEVAPFSNNSPNQNGVYAIGNFIINGTGNLLGTVKGLNFGNLSNGATTNSTITGLKPGTHYWFKVYAFDKAFNYSPGVTTSFSTLPFDKYYNKLNQPLNNLGSWGTNADGSGSNPTSFLSNYQSFNVVQNASLSGNWWIDGLLSKVVVGDGIVPVQFTIPSGFKLLHKYSTMYLTSLDVLKNGTLTIEDANAADSLSLGYMHWGSISKGTIEYIGTAHQRIYSGGEYGNLTLNRGGKTLTGDLVISGNLTIKNNIELSAGFQFYVGGNCQVDAPPPSLDPDDPAYLAAGITMNYSSGAIHHITDNGWGPTIFKNVNIESSTVQLNSDLLIYGDLFIDNGTLNIGTSHLTLNGNLTANSTGTLTGSKNADLTLRNNYTGNLYFNQSIANGNLLNSLTTNSDVELGNKLKIAPSTILDGKNTGFVRVAGGILNTGNVDDFSAGQLVLTSDSSGTARIAEGADDGSYITNRVTLQQFMPARRAWRLITAPVSKTTILTVNKAFQNGQVYNSQAAGGPVNYDLDDYLANGSSAIPLNTPGIGTHITRGTANINDRSPENVMGIGFDYGIAGGGSTPSIRVFNGSNFNNTLADGTNETSIADYPAYMLFVRGDRTIKLADNTSSPNSTTLQYTAEIGKGLQTITNPIYGPTLIGNPYPSPLDFELLHNVNTNLQDKFYVWDSRLGTFGGYRTVANFSGYESMPIDMTLTNNDDARHIQSGQGFFVMPEVNGGGVQIQEGFKSDFSRPQVYGRPFSKMYISLYQRSATDSINLADGVMACFDESFLSAVDNKDALKFANFNENFYLRRNSKRLSIEARSGITANDTLFFGFTNMVVRDYQFKIKAANFGSNIVSAYLIDNFLNKMTPLTLKGDITTINFSITSNAASKNDARFMIVFNANTILPVTLTSVKAYKKNSDIEVEWKVNDEVNVNSYEVEASIDGTLFSAASNLKARNNGLGNEVYTWLDTKPVNGYNYYRIKTMEKSGQVKYSAVVRVLIDKSSKGEISFFPNPVTGRQISLQLNNMEKGNYTIDLFNQLGQKVYNLSFIHNGGTASQTLALKENLPKGIYEMKISGTTIKQFKLVLQ